MRKFLFIINPNAGRKRGIDVSAFIKDRMPASGAYELAVWQDKSHFEEIIALLKNGGFTDAVAAGGDGTVNRVAQTILGTNVRLGILPLGSGNGLARSLGISMDLHTALNQLVAGRETTVDSGTVNGTAFFCTSGIGFDAHIGSLFAESVKRGLQSYIRIIARELFRYRAGEYTLKFDGKTITKKAFLITVANAGQYGNDFYIAPQADMRDGLFHIVIIKPFNILKVIGLLKNILGRKAFLSQSIETYTASRLEISGSNDGFVHYDGEPLKTGAKVIFENLPRSLKVIVGDSFKVA